MRLGNCISPRYLSLVVPLNNSAVITVKYVQLHRRDRSRRATLRQCVSAAILCCIAAAAGSAYAQVKIPGPAIINVVAGQNAMRGYSGDGGQATGAELNEPWGVGVDAAVDLYIAGVVNNRIRKVTASTGVISTVAGDGTAGFSGDGGPATNAELNEPWGVAVD